MAEKDLDDEAEGEEEKAWRWFVALLREDARLKRIVRTWSVWEAGQDDVPWPTDTQTPWVRLTPSAMAVERHTQRTMDAPMGVTVECCVSGLDPKRRMRFWAALRRAMFPVHDADSLQRFNGAMAKAGVRDVKVVRPAWGLDAMTGEAESGGLVVSSGEVKLLSNVPG